MILFSLSSFFHKMSLLQLPKVIIIEILKYLDLQSLSKCLSINHDLNNIGKSNNIWRFFISKDFPEMYDQSFEYDDIYNFYHNLYVDKKLGYPDELVYLFAKFNKSINSLPILDLNDRKGYTDYIDFIKYTELSSGIMRYIDKFDRPGIVYRLTHIPDVTENSRNGVLSVFRRYTDSKSSWSIAIGMVSDIITDHHESTCHPSGQSWHDNFCKDCPFLSRDGSIFNSLNISLRKFNVR